MTKRAERVWLSVTCRTQPADPWICTQNSKSHFQLAYILTGLSHREFGVAKGELDIQLLNTTVVPRLGAK